MGPRNLGVAPFLEAEGVLEKPLKIPKNLPPHGNWSKNLKPSDRVAYHQTLSSVRRYTHFKPLPGLIPVDSLDISLNAGYDHGIDEFAEKIDVVLQASTTGADRRRRMRNTVDIAKESDAVGAAAVEALKHVAKTVTFAGSCYGDTNSYKSAIAREEAKRTYVKYNDYHILHVGGITARKHPSNVKLMNSSHHSPQTNAGYCRQESDGNSYQY